MDNQKTSFESPQYIHLTAQMIGDMRQKLNMTLRDFSDMLGVSQSTVLSWERGTSEPNRTYTVLLAQLQNKIKAQQSETTASKVIKGLLIAGGLTALFAWMYQKE